MTAPLRNRIARAAHERPRSSFWTREQAEALERSGFRPRRNHPRWWTLARGRRLFVLAPDGVLRVRATRGDRELASIGRAGLWRLAGSGAPAWEFELDGALLGVESEADHEESAASALLGWALATADGGSPEGWRAPDEAAVRTWSSRCELDVRAGALVASIAIVRAETRLAAELGLGTLPAGGLGPARSAWLEAVLADANERHRLVRFGRAERDGRPLAEIDLSGAPREHLPALVARACDALAVAARALLPAVDLITNPGVACATLEQCPSYPTRLRP